jgi:hypothetical protein
VFAQDFVDAFCLIGGVFHFCAAKRREGGFSDLSVVGGTGVYLVQVFEWANH